MINRVVSTLTPIRGIMSRSISAFLVVPNKRQPAKAIFMAVVLGFIAIKGALLFFRGSTLPSWNR
uniref:Uncharacterized protein n=1 Tax=Rhizophora mucronata TaxID=61149 RepID=A0A2P2MZ21_RHIMU